MHLPASAVLEREGTASVFVVDEHRGTVSEQPVTILGRHDGLVTLASPLKAGTRVVTAGVKSLTPGQRVRPESGIGR